jgi:hypothetical protein
MILRVYGETVQSVSMHFDSKAFNEVGFRRDRRHSIPVEEFERDWQKVAEHEIVARDEGVVQDHTQQRLLDKMEQAVQTLLDGLGEDEALRIENDERNWPKARDTQRKIVEDGRNRLHFEAWVDPPLRVAVWRRTAG